MRYLLTLLWALLLTGCQTTGLRPLEDRTPAGSSSMSKLDAAAIAGDYVRLYGGTLGNVSPTGSMAPVLDSRSLLLLEPYHGQQLHVGDIVVYDRGDQPNVVHRIVEIRGDAFYVSGDNNQWPDGWFKLSAIKYRVAGVLYTARP